MWTIDLGRNYGKDRDQRHPILDWQKRVHVTLHHHKPSSTIMMQKPKHVDAWLEVPDGSLHQVRIMRSGAMAFVDCPMGSVNQQRIALLLGCHEAVCKHCMTFVALIAEAGPTAFYSGAWSINKDLYRMCGRDALRDRLAERRRRDYAREALADFQPGRFSHVNMRLSTQNMAMETWNKCMMYNGQKWRTSFGASAGLVACVTCHKRGWGQGTRHGTFNMPTAWRFLYMRGFGSIGGYLAGAIASVDGDHMEAWLMRVNSPATSSDFHLADVHRDPNGVWRVSDWRRGWSWRTVMLGKTKPHRAMKARMFRPDGTLRVMPDGFTLNTGIIGGV